MANPNMNKNKIKEASDDFAGWIAFYNGKKLEIKKDEAKDLWGAKQLAVKHFKVPTSKQGRLAIKPAYNESISSKKPLKESGEIRNLWGINLNSDVFTMAYKFYSGNSGVKKVLEKAGSEILDGGNPKSIYTVLLNDLKKVINSSDFDKIVQLVNKKSGRALLEPSLIAKLSDNDKSQRLAQVMAMGMYSELKDDPHSVIKDYNLSSLKDKANQFSKTRGAQKLGVMMKNKGIGESTTKKKIKQPICVSFTANTGKYLGETVMYNIGDKQWTTKSGFKIEKPTRLKYNGIINGVTPTKKGKPTNEVKVSPKLIQFLKKNKDQITKLGGDVMDKLGTLIPDSYYEDQPDLVWLKKEIVQRRNENKMRSKLKESSDKNYYKIGGDSYDGGVVLTVFVDGKKVHNDIRDGDHDWKYKGKKYADIFKMLDVIAKENGLRSNKDLKRINMESTNKISRSKLKEIVSSVLQEDEEYKTFFKKALEKAGKSIPNMTPEEKKDFFNKIDKSWKGKGEKNEDINMSTKRAMMVIRKGNEIVVAASSFAGNPNLGFQQLKSFNDLNQAIQFANKMAKGNESIEVYDKVGSSYKPYKKNIQKFESKNESKIYLDTSTIDQIKQSVKMGFNIVKVGMITPKKKGVALVNKKSQVRGTYPLEAKDAIEQIISQSNESKKKDIGDKLNEEKLSLDDLKRFYGKGDSAAVVVWLLINGKVKIKDVIDDIESWKK